MPWPKGKPRSPEVHAKMLEAGRLSRALLSPEEKEERRKRRSASMRRAWAGKSPDERADWKDRCAEALALAREVRAAKKSAPLSQLTDEKRREYREYRNKGFRCSEALSLVETGRLP